MLNYVDDSFTRLSMEERTEPVCMERMYRALKAICHPLRVKILHTLGNGELCVGDLVERTETSQSNISQHLGILHDRGILTSRKKANQVYYRLVDRRVLRLLGTMQDVFCSHEQR